MDDRAYNPSARERVRAGFTLLEVLTAVAILGLTCSSVLIVIDRCISSASDSAQRREAFEVARENLERILVADTVEESVDFGTSERFPGISWQTVIEGFPEPVTGQMWVRAVCTSEYTDSTGQTRTVELVHWLTPLTDQQAGQLVDQQELEKLQMEQLIQTEQEAAKYAKVNAEMLRQWIENGLLRTEEDMFLRYNLDIFVQAQGDPTPEQKAEQVESVHELALKLRTQQRQLEENGLTGLSNQELETMSPDQIRDLVNTMQK